MLPEHHHPHDAQWLKEQLGRLPAHLKNKAIAGYEAAYLEAHDAEPVEHRKDGRARFAANSRLRDYIDKIMLAKPGHACNNY